MPSKLMKRRRAFFFTIRNNVNAFCNFVSTISTWAVMAVSLER